jgi:hypothetical protein
MKIADRLRRIEAASGVTADRRRQIAADAADFVRQVETMAARVTTPSTTDGFWNAIRASGDPYLISTFLGEGAHAHS